MDLLDSTEKIVSLSAAAFGGVAVFFKKVVMPKIKKYKEGKERRRLMEEKINKIHAEISPNGGGSIKDGIERMKKDISQIYNLNMIQALKINTLFSATKEALFEANIAGQFVWTNAAFNSLFGASNSELLGEGWVQFLHSDSLDESYETWREAVRLHRPHRDRYKIINGESGRVIDVECIANPIKNTTGKILGFFGKVIEIST